MICKNCSVEYGNGELFCPKCGAQNENFETAFNDDIGVSFFDDDLMMNIPSAGDTGKIPLEFDDSVWKVIDKEEKPFKVSLSSEDTVDFSADITPPAYEDEPEADESAPKVKKVKVSGKEKSPEKTKTGKRTKASADKITVEEKKNLMLIVAILCGVFCFALILSTVAVKTDVFKKHETPVQAVALAGLSAQETAALEAQLKDCFSAVRDDFDSSNCSGDGFISRIIPSDSGNFFRLLSSAEIIAETTPDPAMRFCDEYGNYSYYKIGEGEIEKVLKNFSLKSLKQINTQSCYYYGGNYYFAANPGAKITPAVFADVKKTKKILDGSFYAECVFYAQGGDASKSLTRYLVVEKETDEATGKYSFIIKKANDEPLFTDSGNPTDNSAVSVKMKTETVECKTNDGTLFRRYVIEYPVFTGDSLGEQNANKFYSDILSVYNLSVQSAQKDYEDYISKGGNKDDLPFRQTITTKVTMNNEQSLSFVEYITSYSPELPEVQQEESTSYEDNGYDSYYEESSQPQESEQEPVELDEVKVEAYTFDKKTGEYVSKDAILGKSYLVISEALYRIYNGYDYSNVFNEIQQETTAVSDEEDYYYDYDYDYDYAYEESEEENGIPKDEDGLGVMIYESAWSISEYGVVFYYVDEDGIVHEVVIPADFADKLLSYVENSAVTEASTDDSGLWEEEETTEEETEYYGEQYDEYGEATEAAEDNLWAEY